MSNQPADGSFDPNKVDLDEDEVDFGDKKPEATRPLGSEPVQQGDAIRDAQPGGLALSKEALATKAKLDKEPKVMFMVPLDPGEQPGAGLYRAVTINGYRFEVKKNMMVLMPQSVARVLMNAYNIENSVQSNHPLNLNNRPGARNALS